MHGQKMCKCMVRNWFNSLTNRIQECVRLLNCRCARESNCFMRCASRFNAWHIHDHAKFLFATSMLSRCYRKMKSPPLYDVSRLSRLMLYSHTHNNPQKSLRRFFFAASRCDNPLSPLRKTWYVSVTPTTHSPLCRYCLNKEECLTSKVGKCAWDHV